MIRQIEELIHATTTRQCADFPASVVEAHQRTIERHTQLDVAYSALQSLWSPEEDDLRSGLRARLAELADVLALADLEARLQQVGEGIYLAIPYMYTCSDKQPVYLVNRTAEEVIYIGRRLYAFASDGDDIVDYNAAGSAFADGIAASATLSPGEKLAVDEYSMGFDGDFIGTHRIRVMIRGEQVELRTRVGRLGGYSRGSLSDTPGIHLLEVAAPAT